jgi:diguanylate cyclase (GGDEF)-like protein
MSLDVTLSAILIFAAASYFLLGLRLLIARRDTGTMPMGTLFVVISVWVIGGAIELLSSDFLLFTIGRTCHFFGTALLPIAALVAFREYTGSKTAPPKLLLLIIIPAVSIVLAASNTYHEAMWYLPIANEAGQYLTRPERWGPWFLFVHAPYSYAVIGAAMLTLILHSSSVAPVHRRGLFLLVAACVAPLTTTLAYDLGFGSNTISFVPFLFAAMLPAYTWLIVGQKIVEFSPVAYETVFQNMRDPVVVVDEQNRIIGLNHGAETMLNISETQALRSPIAQVLGNDCPEVLEALESGEPQNMMTATGRFLHVQSSQIAARGASARSGRVLMFRDVSDVEKAQSEVRASEQLLRTLIDHSANGIVRMRWSDGKDGAGRSLLCIFANAAAGRFLGVDPNAVVAEDAAHVLKLVTRDTEDSEGKAIRRTARKAMVSGKRYEVELCQNRVGSKRWLRLVCEPVGDDIAVTIVDVTAAKAKERRMESIAWSDPLTGVLNRRGFERDATSKLSGSADDATGALLFIDLNGFKQINDDFGHEVGDQLLKVAARRLTSSLRSCDIIGRPGGDEFVALVPDVQSDTADKLAERLTLALEKPYVIGSQVLDCAASIGLALYPEHASTLTGLLREADEAMYRAKARCRNVVSIRTADLLEKAM